MDLGRQLHRPFRMLLPDWWVRRGCVGPCACVPADRAQADQSTFCSLGPDGLVPAAPHMASPGRCIARAQSRPTRGLRRTRSLHWLKR
eukprot:15026379-Alexandrium_andersonii.AAC.1